MARDGYSPNLYGVRKFGDLNLVVVKINTSGRVAADSSPDTTSAAAGSGVYNVTYPKATRGWVVGAELVKSASDGIYPEVLAFDPTAGTIQLELSDEANLTSTEEIHLTLLLGSL